LTEDVLLMDGVRYRLWDYDGDEVKEFEPIVIGHIKDIFGDGCEYFPKQKLKTLADNRSIPDGFVVDFKNQKWYIVELKLLCDDAIRRVAGQIVKYKNALRNLRTKRDIYKSIKSIRDADFLDDLINDEKPRIVIIIDSLNGRLGEQFKEQVDGTDRDIKIVEFKTFRRENAPSVHAYLFESLYKLKTIEKSVTVIPPKREEHQSPENRVEIELTHSSKEYNLIPISRCRHFFPGYKVEFILDTDIGDIKARVSSAPGGTQIGDPHAGNYIKSVIRGELTKWYDAHPELKAGDKIIIEAIEPKKRYRLRVAK